MMNHILSLMSGQIGPAAKPGPVLCHPAPSGGPVSGVAAGTDHSATRRPSQLGLSENLCQRSHICDSHCSRGKTQLLGSTSAPGATGKGEKKTLHLGLLCFYRSLSYFQFPISQRKLREGTFSQEWSLWLRKVKI